MIRQIVFGDRWIDVDLADDVKAVPPGITIPVEPADDLQAAVGSALDHPIDLPPLRHLAQPGSRVVVAFDDPTVPCYTPLWPIALGEILSDLGRAGVKREDITLVCANSLHRQFTHDELARLIGDNLVSDFGPRLVCHDAEDPKAMTEIGVTENGYFVDLNRLVVEADLTVYLDCSTTRGFSGGWKSICVGLSSYRSIAHHHTPETMSMTLDRNPMHAMLDEMGALTLEKLGAEKFFKLETVLANPLQVAKIFGGSVDATRNAALEMNRAHLSNRRDMIDEKADILVYGVPDWSPYAAYSFTNPILSMISTGLGYLGGMIEALGKPGCTVILATPCPDRWDHEHHPSYKEVWDRVIPETKDPNEARRLYEEEFATRDDYRERYRFGYGFHGVHGIMALYPLKRLRHAGRVIVAGAEDPSIPEHVGFSATATVEDALAEARGAHGNSSVVLVEYPMANSRQ